jgi:hypothetical protein
MHWDGAVSSVELLVSHFLLERSLSLIPTRNKRLVDRYWNTELGYVSTNAWVLP